MPRSTANTSLYVTHLSQKIETDSTKPRLITTESGIGYRFGSGEE
jgi:DNA-binding response OmpR family regulator